MSVQAITWALGRAPNIAMQAVLFSLANRADEWGITYVGQDTVADECSCRRATVTTNMGKLEAAGVIARFARRDAGGRRSSDVVVLAPRWSDRGGLRDADRRAESMFGPDVTAAAQCTPGVRRDENQGTFHGDQSTLHGRQGTPSVHEPSEEPSVNTTASSSSTARARELEIPADVQLDAAALLRGKAKVATRLVTPDEMLIAAAALSEFNRQAGSDFGLGSQLVGIVGRVRERPSWDAETHRRLVRSAWRIRWWERSGSRRRATPQVIYGNAKVFEQVVQDAVDERAGRLRDMSDDRSLRDKRWPDGRGWDELTAEEQHHAREAVVMGLRPWVASEPAPVASSNGHAAGVTADTFLDD